MKYNNVKMFKLINTVFLNKYKKTSKRQAKKGKLREITLILFNKETFIYVP